MTDNDNEILASLKGFTPGPWGTDTGGEVHMHGRTVFAWPKWADQSNIEEIHSNMRLGAAAPDLHRIATEQAAEIARLRRCLSGLLGFHDGEPMTWVESERRIDAARAALAAKS